MKRSALVLSSLMVLTSTGCALFQRDRDMPDEARIPATYSLYSGDVELDRWWAHFNSDDLDALIEEALTRNFSLQEAEARLRQAAAQARRDRALLYPELDVSAGGSYRREDSPSPNERNPGNDTFETERYNLGLLISSYEVDLWGRVRSLAGASRLQAEASREDFNTAAMTVSAAVAENWIRLVASDAQLRLVRDQLKTSRTVLDLLQLRFRNGLSSALDVYQQEQVVAELAAGIPLIEAQIAALQHQLAVLVGKPPAADLGPVADTLPDPDPRPSAGLPADLLARRPDIRAAGLRLRAADQRVAAARADRLPALRITAGAQYESGELDSLFDNWILNLSANLVGPVFDAGRRRAEVDRSVAVADERLAAYRGAVYRAVQEVEDALVREDKQIEHVAGVKRQTDVASKALDEAQMRYRNGLNDYLPVLTQILAVQRLERDLISKTAEAYLFRVALCRALGGAWMDPSQVAPADSTAEQYADHTQEQTP